MTLYPGCVIPVCNCDKKQMAIVKRRSASTQIIDYLLNQIIEGKLKEGDKLAGEREFAEMLGVSRVPLREAITALSLIGILTPRQGEGTFVSRYNPEIFGKAIYANVVMDNTAINDIMRVRCMIESNAAEFASVVATKNDLAIIREAKIRHADTVSKYLDGEAQFEEIIIADHAFHNAIAASTHNHFFKQFFDVLKHSIKYCHMIYFNRPESFPSFVVSHQKIFDSIAAGKSHDAYRHMHDHISDFKSDSKIDRPSIDKIKIKRDIYEYKSHTSRKTRKVSK